MPLFILDGFETTLQRIIDLDPERVESITILKDAAGTALYGSRASNGVLVFETKKPVSYTHLGNGRLEHMVQAWENNGLHLSVTIL